MKSSSILVALVLLGLALAACNKPVEEQASAKEGNGNVAEGTSEPQRKLPECAQRDKDGAYKHPGGCTTEQWAEWSR